MTPGKASAQAGHAFLDSFLTAPADVTSRYLSAGGTKIVLSTPDERSLCDLYYRAKAAGWPCALVVESEHVMPPAFDGSPILTAVGIGPVWRWQGRELLKRLPLMK